MSRVHATRAYSKARYTRYTAAPGARDALAPLAVEAHQHGGAVPCGLQHGHVLGAGALPPPDHGLRRRAHLQRLAGHHGVQEVESTIFPYLWLPCGVLLGLSGLVLVFVAMNVWIRLGFFSSLSCPRVVRVTVLCVPVEMNVVHAQPARVYRFERVYVDVC